MAHDLALDPGLILDHVLDALVIVDTRGRVLWTNSVFRQMIGRPDEDLVGRSCCELGVGSFCEKYCPLPATPTTASCELDVHFNVQVDGRAGEGEPGAYCFVRSPVRDREDRVIGYLENFRGMDRVRDVILQLEQVTQAIEAERQTTENLINSMADGVLSVDEDLRIQRFTPNMAHMLGISADDAIGRPCREVLKGTLCDTDCPLVWSRDHEQPVTSCREQLTGRDGRAIEVTISTGLLRSSDSDGGGLFAIVTDRSELESLRRNLDGRTEMMGMIGAAPPVRALFAQIEAVASTEATVLIEGESGTGKELVARALHAASNRSAGPFVAVNCAALTETLLESELFGHVKGSFTGAIHDRAGRFVQATGGTLFLDEIGDTSLALQVRLLRAVQEKTIDPVGSDASRRVDVRIVTATHRDLREEVRRGRFREDLYYRLGVIPIQVPPLRNRREDIPLLVEHFARKHRRAHGFPEPRDGVVISERALALLEQYDWPGNVRELEHAVEYALISNEGGRIERAFLPAPLRGNAGPSAVGGPGAVGGHEPLGTERSADDEERDRIAAALEANHWSMARTASELGWSRTTLWRHMKRLGLRRD